MILGLALLFAVHQTDTCFLLFPWQLYPVLCVFLSGVDVTMSRQGMGMVRDWKRVDTKNTKWEWILHIVYFMISLGNLFFIQEKRIPTPSLLVDHPLF